MCGGQNDADDNGCGDGENVKLQDNLPIGMTIMDFDTLTPSRWLLMPKVIVNSYQSNILGKDEKLY